MSRYASIAFTAAVLTSAGALAQGRPLAANDAGPVASAEITLEAAVSTAETHAQGKAARAEFEKQKDGQWVYDVEVVAGAKVFDVKIDARKGTVIASTADKADADDAADQAD